MPEDNHVRIVSIRPTFSKEQKAALGLLVAFGSLGLIFGVFYLWKHIAAPFAVSYTGPRFQTASEQESAEITKAKQTDTDGDTLSDYDELYVYKTSPYLLDSDSDGVADNTEIVAGQDPSCATGDACDVETAQAQSDLSGSFLDETADAYRYTADGSVANIPSSYSVQDVVNALSSEELRKMLIDSGADASQLEQFSDDDLRALLVTALNQMQASGASATTTTTPETSTTTASGTTDQPSSAP